MLTDEQLAAIRERAEEYLPNANLRDVLDDINSLIDEIDRLKVEIYRRDAELDSYLLTMLKTSSDS